MTQINTNTRANTVMNQDTSAVLESVTIKVVATQLKDATENGRRHSRNFVRQIQRDVDQHVQVGPRRLGRPSTLAILAVIVLGGITGFLGAATAQSWPMAGLLFVLMTLGVFLLDQVRLTQHRDDAFKAGLYLAATNHRCPITRELPLDNGKV